MSTIFFLFILTDILVFWATRIIEMQKATIRPRFNGLPKEMGAMTAGDRFPSPAVVGLKRFFDVSASLFLLLLTLPLCVLAALLIAIDSPGGVFFSQTRVGRADKDGASLIKIYKFRTMRKNAEAETGPVWAKKDDDRITRVGRFLRKTRIDEIPQLFNVLMGEMSLIGPRPERPEFYKALEQDIPGYSVRTLNILPGITGLAQCSQGYDTSIKDVESKLRFDLLYRESLSSLPKWALMETKIVFRTILVIISLGGH